MCVLLYVLFKVMVRESLVSGKVLREVQMCVLLHAT